MRNEQKSTFHLKKSLILFLLGKYRECHIFSKISRQRFPHMKCKNFHMSCMNICTWISICEIHRFHITCRKICSQIFICEIIITYSMSKKIITKVFLHEICRIPYSNIAENLHLSSVRYT